MIIIMIITYMYIYIYIGARSFKTANLPNSKNKYTNDTTNDNNDNT